MQVSLAVALALAAVLGLKSAGPSGAAELNSVATSAADCQEATIAAHAEADAWVDQNSEFANKGSDAILNAKGGPSGWERALVRFALPSQVPNGCVVKSATLRLYSPEESVGAKAEVVRVASGWSEGEVTWSNQPATIGDGVRVWSTEGYMEWNVTSQVQAIFETANHGFLIRDSAEGAEASVGEHSFHSKEKGDGADPPELVIHFAAPRSDEPPDPPAPPVPAAVNCGQVLTQSTQLTNDLFECPGDGLVIGAPRIIVDLSGHTIDGVGLGSGISNQGHASVTVRNGTVQEFDYGVRLLPETKLNVVEGLTLQGNQLAGIELFDAHDNEIRGNTIDKNGDGIALVNETTATVVVGNTINLSSGWGLRVQNSNDNSFESNTVTGSGDRGIGLEHANRNMLLMNSVSGSSDLGIGLQHASENKLSANSLSGNSDGGIEIREGSTGNLVEHNQIDGSGGILVGGDHGILVDGSDRNWLISNTAHHMSDNGIFLSKANDCVMRGNDVRFNAGGFQVDGSHRNWFEANDANNTTGIGIEVESSSVANMLVGNTASNNGAQGINIDDAALDGLANVVMGNTANGNLSDGIATSGSGQRITGNLANGNGGWGINAALGTIDGGSNLAASNFKPEQCVGVVCNDHTPPVTMIADKPPDPSNGAPSSFSFTGSDNANAPEALAFECRLYSQNETDYAACSSPISYPDLAIGPHTFAVRATDLAGNVGIPATHQWTVSTAVVCPTPTTVLSNADAWFEQNSPSSNKGSDSILKVRSQRSNNNFRALVQFALPNLPPGCKVESATLQVYAASATTGRTINAIRVVQSWTELAVTWGNQPGTTGPAATTSSGLGYRQWNVKAQVHSMYDAGADHGGFLIRDAAENGPGAEQSFHSKEKGETPPQLVISYAPAGN